MDADTIRQNALLRLSQIFNVPVEALRPEYRFGEDLKPSFVSDFRDNELDQVNCDIHDVADRATVRDFVSGHLIIWTVEEYCQHMIQCSRTKPKAVQWVLRMGPERA